MATLTGMDRSERAITQAIKSALSGPVKKFIMNDLNFTLKSQTEKSGKKFPKKAESTIKAYKAQGYNTKDFLVRTGESTRLKAEVDEYEGKIQLMITPIGHEVLSYHVPSRVDWFGEITNAERDVIMNILNEEIKRNLQ